VLRLWFRWLEARRCSTNVEVRPTRAALETSISSDFFATDYITQTISQRSIAKAEWGTLPAATHDIRWQQPREAASPAHHTCTMVFNLC
jgi:hypothetical protein